MKTDEKKYIYFQSIMKVKRQRSVGKWQKESGCKNAPQIEVKADHICDWLVKVGNLFFSICDNR